MFRKLVTLFSLLITLLAQSTLLIAADKTNLQRIILLESKSDRISSNFSSHLRTNINLRTVGYDVVKIDVEQPEISFDAPLVVTIGEKALNKVLASNYNGSVLATLISPEQYNKAKKLNNKTQAKFISAIFHESSPIRQLLLFKEILPTGKRVGFLISAKEKESFDELKKFAYKVNLILEHEVVDSPQNLSKSLLRLINRSDAIIATNNPNIYNRSTIKSILLTLYRHNKFLIGSNKRFIKPGSVATTYTSLQHLLDEVVDEVNYFFKFNQKLHSAKYSQRFDIAFNKEVAHSLNLTVKENSHYIDAIQAAEISLGESAVYE